MGLKDVDAAPTTQFDSYDERADSFAARTALQQFMNENGPIFNMLARRYAEAGKFPQTEDFERLFQASIALSMEVSRQILNKPNVDGWDIKPVRAACAQFVSECWAENEPYDVEMVAAVIASGTRYADPKIDINYFKGKSISNDTSVAMTAAGVAARLTKSVMYYDFRDDRSALIGKLTEAVLALAAQAMDRMLPAGATEDDHRSLFQTLANRLAEVMESVYRREATTVVSHLLKASEEEKVQFLANFDHVGHILASFREWGVYCTASAIALTRGASTLVKNRQPSTPGHD
jgi:hypothetical protein